jgi:hypothetical protein
MKESKNGKNPPENKTTKNVLPKKNQKATDSKEKKDLIIPKGKPSERLVSFFASVLPQISTEIIQNIKGVLVRLIN